MTELSWESIRSAAGGFIHGPSGRSIPMLTFALDHLTWGSNAFGYKLTNLLLHSLNSVLIFFLAHFLVRFQAGVRQTTNSTGTYWPLFIAACWAIHPIQTSTVLYVVQRMEIMAVTFILLGLLAYIRARCDQITGRSVGWHWLLLAAVCGLLSLFCKETGLLLGLFALCLELTIFQFRAASNIHQKILRSAYSIAGIAALAAYLFVIWPKYTEPLAYASRTFAWDERLLTQLRVLSMYLSQILWPDPNRHLFFYDNYTVSTGLLSPPTTLLGAILLFLLLAAAMLVRQRFPLVSLGILLFFASHFLTSNVVPLELVFEHRNYFAVFGVVLAATSLLLILGKKLSQLPLVPVSVVIFLGLGSITAISSATWGDPLAHAMHLKYINPSSERAGYRLGEMYLRLSDNDPNSPFFGFARNEFERLVDLGGTSPMPEQALIAMHARTGQEVDTRWWDSLIEKVRTGPGGPQQISAVRRLLHFYNIGIPLDSERLMEAGIELISKPRVHPVIHFNFATHALESLQDERLASLLIINASRTAQDHNWDRQMINDLVRREHHQFAERMATELEADRKRLQEGL